MKYDHPRSSAVAAKCSKKFTSYIESSSNNNKTFLPENIYKGSQWVCNDVFA